MELMCSPRLSASVANAPAPMIATALQSKTDRNFRMGNFIDYTQRTPNASSTGARDGNSGGPRIDESCIQGSSVSFCASILCDFLTDETDEIFICFHVVFCT